MGNLQVSPGVSDSSDSESLDTSSIQQFLSARSTSASANMNQQYMSSDSSVDAVASRSFRIDRITDEQQVEISKLLDEYEMISIVFLVAESYETALDIMIKLKKSGAEFNKFLTKVIKAYSTKIIIEALCVIQNYEILRMLGYNKFDLITNFSPQSCHCTIHINKVRKLCYMIMEKMTIVQEKKLLQSIREDLYNTDISFYEFPYLEMNFAYLFAKNYIGDSDLSNIIKHFKVLELDHFVDMLQICTPPSANVLPNSSVKNSRSGVNTDQMATIMGITDRMVPFLVKQSSSSSVSSNIYPMNPDRPGIVLIIENINFFEDLDSDLEHLVIKTDTNLEEREGSNRDSTRLCDIFGRFGFEIIHKKDQTHQQMLDLVVDVTHNQISEEHSCFILIMLSHGLLNQIIGCNSIPLNVDEIKQNMNSKVLEGKPKILIFQACQGNDVLAIQPSDVRTDAPRATQRSQEPWQRHILEFWSAVPGAVSFRSIIKGSWMVQTLCDVLESSNSETSFYDICTRVTNIINERWVEYERQKINVMLPVTHSTLDKKFILPVLKLN